MALGWYNFQEIVKRLAHADGEVDECRVWGVSGDSQDGIDLFGWRHGPERRRVVIQCKNYSPKNLKSSVIDSAITEFLCGDKVEGTRLFVLACAPELETQALARSVDAARKALAARGIDFEPWDGASLTERLRKHPELVHAFFDSEEWVRRVCGADGLAAVAGRPSPAERRRALVVLGEVYAGWSERAGGGGFVPPDLVVRKLARQAPAGTVDPGGASSGDELGPTSPTSVDQRVSVDSGLATNGGRILLINDLGEGKSTLLRSIGSDLLGSHSLFPRLGGACQDCMPLYVGFPQFSRAHAGAAKGIEESLLAVLVSAGAADAEATIRDALRHRKVLLLMDGLDEASDRDHARDAVSAIVTWARHDVRLVLAGRRTGVADLSLDDGWSRTSIAPLDHAQQRQLVALRLTAEGSGRAVDDFFSWGAPAGIVAGLLENPLFLSYLCRTWLRDGERPRSRGEALDGILTEALVRHPRERCVGTQAQPPFDLGPEDVRASAAGFALHLHDGGRASCTAAEARTWWRARAARLRTDLSLVPSVPQIADGLLRWLRTPAGLIVGTDETVQFFHHSFQERLAAEALLTEAASSLVARVERTGSSPFWAGVWPLLVAGLRADSAQAVLTALESVRADRPDLLWLDVVILDCVAEPGSLASGPRDQIVRRLARAAECASGMPQRGDVITRLVRLAAGSPAGSVARGALQRWFPGRTRHVPGMYRTMEGWPAEAPTLFALARAILEGGSDGLAAVDALVQVCSNHPAAVASLADIPVPETPTGAATWLLARTRLDPEAVSIAELNSAWNSGAPELVAAAGIGLVGRGIALLEMRDHLLWCLTRRSALDWSWRPIVVDALVQGWSADDGLRALSLHSLTESESGEVERLDSESVTRVLLRGFGKHPDVLTWCRRELERDRPFSALHHDWADLLIGAELVPLLGPEVDRFLDTGRDPIYGKKVSLAKAARSEASKRALIAGARETNSMSGARHLPALIEGWGLDDSEVAPLVRDLLSAGGERLARSSHHLKVLVPEDGEREVVAADGLNQWPAWALSGVLETIADLPAAAPSLRSAALARFGSLCKSGDVPVRFASRWKDEAQVRRPLFDSLDAHEAPFWALGRVAATDVELRAALIARLPTLNVAGRRQFASAGAAIGRPADALNESWTLEVDPIARTECAAARSNDLSDEFLADELRATGMEMETRRYAALTACLRSGRPRLFLDTVDHVGTVRLFSPTPWNSPPALWLEVCRNLPALSEALGADLWKRLGGDLPVSPALPYLIDLIAPAADRFEGSTRFMIALMDRWHVETEVLSPREARNQAHEIMPGGETLRFIARVRPRSALLLHACSLALGAYGNDVPLVAAELLADHFGDDTDLRDRLLSSDWLGDAELYLVARAWPEQLPDAKSFPKETKGTILTRAITASICGPRGLGLFLREWSGSGSTWGQFHVAAGSSILARRLARDPGLATALAADLLADPSPSLQMTVAHLLHLAGAGRMAIDWAREQLGRANPPYARIGFDAVSDRFDSTRELAGRIVWGSADR